MALAQTIASDIETIFSTRGASAVDRLGAADRRRALKGGAVKLDAMILCDYLDAVESGDAPVPLSMAMHAHPHAPAMAA